MLDNFATIVTFKQQGSNALRIRLLDHYLLQNALKFTVSQSIENFQFSHQAHNVPQKEDDLETISINYVAIWKSLYKPQPKQKDKLVASLHAILKTISTLLARKGFYQIDLGILGKFSVIENSIIYEPLIPNQNTVYLDEFPRNTNVPEKAAVSKLLSNSSNFFYPPLAPAKKKQEVPYFRNRNLGREKIQEIKFEKQNRNLAPLNSQNFNYQNSSQLYDVGAGKNTRKQFQLNPLLKSIIGFDSPTRRFMNPSIAPVVQKHKSQNTECKPQVYSYLAHDAESLIKQNFSKPQQSKIQFPTIIDKFARTLAAPTCAQKYNMSVCGRIGSNYNLCARGLGFDQESKCVIWVMSNRLEQKARLKSNNPDEGRVATEAEELKYLIDPIKHKNIQKLVNAKKASNDRYALYIKRQIPFDCVAPIRQTWILKILQKIPLEFQLFPQENVQTLVDSMLQVISRDYFSAVKQSILEYILKDPDEQRRTGIISKPKSVQDWGRSLPPKVKISEASIAFTRCARQQMRNNLLIMPKCTLRVMQQWKKHQDQLFLNLPRKRSQPMSLLQFSKKQQERIAQVRNRLRNQWFKTITWYVKQDMKDFFDKSSTYKLVRFFRSINTIMSNQLRELVSESLLRYLQFFRQFKKKQYKTPQQIILEQKEKKHTMQPVFLSIKLKDQNHQIVFSDELEQRLKPELLGLIDQVVAETNEFPKIQNDFSSQKSYLWSIPQTDDIYIQVYNEVSRILEDNFNYIQSTKSIYSKYAFLLSKEQELKTWCKDNNDIKEYRQKLAEFDEIYYQILDELPFYIRMNMVLVDCTEIKKKYLQIIQNLREILYQSMYEKVRKFNEDINRRVQSIKEALKPKAQTTLKLLELECEIDRVKKVENALILKDYGQLKSWMSLLYDTGCGLLTHDNFLSICLTTNSIFSLKNKIEFEQLRILRQKEELQKVIRKQMQMFSANAISLLHQLNGLVEEFTMRKMYVNYNRSIKLFSEKASQALVKMNNLNTQQQHLGWAPTTFPQIVQMQKTLKPNEELWSTIARLDQNIKQWKTVPVRTLNPEAIESYLTETISSLKQIVSLLPRNQTSPVKIANEAKYQLTEFQQKYLPLIRIFANKGLKQRHWQEFRKLFPICENTETLNLYKIITLRMVEEVQKVMELENISARATREFKIEKIKAKMLEEWNSLVIEIMEYKDTFIVAEKSFKEIEQKLVAYNSKTAQIRKMPDSLVFDQSLSQWQKMLGDSYRLFYYWTRVQVRWLCLEAVFGPREVGNSSGPLPILKSLPIQQSDFQMCDSSWKSLMKRMTEQPKVVDFFKNKKIVDIFVDCEKKLQQVVRGLQHYLQQRRLETILAGLIGNTQVLRSVQENKIAEAQHNNIQKADNNVFYDPRVNGVFALFLKIPYSQQTVQNSQYYYVNNAAIQLIRRPIYHLVQRCCCMYSQEIMSKFSIDLKSIHRKQSQRVLESMIFQLDSRSEITEEQSDQSTPSQSEIQSDSPQNLVMQVGRKHQNSYRLKWSPLNASKLRLWLCRTRVTNWSPRYFQKTKL